MNAAAPNLRTLPWRSFRAGRRLQAEFPVTASPHPALFAVTGPTPWVAPENDAPQPPRSPHYVIEHCLGEGGGGVVWLAWDRRRCRLVALKCLRVQLLGVPGAVARFEREAQITASLVHAGVPRVYDQGVFADGVPYYTQRYVPGTHLGALLARRGGAMSRPDTELLRWFARVCWTVADAHARGVVHLDIKPSNILLGEGHGAWLIDWGIARVEGEPLPTGRGGLFGTLGYMAPECLRAGPVAGTRSADVFSLGMTLFEVLAGRRPFEARNELAFAVKVCCERVPDPRTLTPGIPAALAELCNLALQPEPAERTLSAAGMARALEHWLAGQRVPTRWVARGQRALR